jgi:hypothetical protein
MSHMEANTKATKRSNMKVSKKSRKVIVENINLVGALMLLAAVANHSIIAKLCQR